MLNEATIAALPPVRTPRRWLRRGTLISLIALALLAGEGYRRHRNWQNFLQDLGKVNAGVGSSVSRNPLFEKSGLPDWMLDRFPFVRKEFSLGLGNSVNDRWLLKHADALHSSRITSVDLQSDAVTDEGLKVFRNHPALEFLSLKGKLYSPDCLAALGHLRNLSTLELTEVSLSEASVKQLADWPKLKQMLCHGNSSGLSQLDGLKRLFLLHLSHASDESLARISANSSMQILALQESTFTDASIAKLLSFPQLRAIFCDGPQISEEGAAKLKAAKIGIHLP